MNKKKSVERKKKKTGKISKKRIIKNIFLVFIILYLAVFIYHQAKPLPKNISYESEIYNTSEESIFKRS